MQVLQLFYTSCESGLSSGKGFQTYSMSPGIRAEERREIESLCGYRPPDNLPAQPTPKEISDLFPMTFGCRQLQSGRYVVWQITYLGQDYSGRYGNYFVHALVLEPTTLDFNTLAVYPIQWYRSKVFRQCLTDSEAAVTSSPEPLPVLDIQKLVPNPDLTFAEVANFLKEEDRRTLLAPLLSALLDYPTTHRRLVLVDEPASIPYWMVALQLAFPKKLVPHLSFLTYTYDPYTTGELVCATQENTRFNVANSSQNFSFFVVNGLDKSFNQKTVNHYEVVDLIETSYLFHEGNLNAFHTFLEATDYDALDADLEAAYYLYLITHSEVADLNNKIAPALQFANRYVTHSELLGELALRLDQVIDDMVGKLDLQNAQVVVQFLVKVAQAGTNYLQIAANFYRGFLNHFIFESSLTLADLTQFNHAVLANSPFGNELRKPLIDAKNLKPLRHLMAKATPERTEIGLTLFSETCLAIGPDLPNTSEVIFLEGVTILSKSPSHLQSYLDALLQKNGQFFIQVIVLVWSQVPHVQPVLLNGLQSVLRFLDATRVLSIRRELIKLKQFHLVFEMFKQAFAQAPDPVKFFWAEHQSLFATIPNYGDAYFAEAVKQYDGYLTTLSEDEHPWIATEYQKLLDVATLIKDKQVLSTLVPKMEIHLSFSSDKKNFERAEQLVTLKKSLGVKTKLDVCSLVLFGFKLAETRRGKTSLSKLLMSPDRPNMAEFRNCDTEEECQRHRMMFCDYLHWILPLLLKWRPLVQEQGLLFAYLNPQEDYLEEDLVELYLTHLTNYLQDNKKEVGWLDEFLVFYFNSPERPKTMNKNLVKTTLLNLPKVYLDYLQSDTGARKAIVESKKTSFALFMRELRRELNGLKEEQSGGLFSKLSFWKK